MRFPAGPSLLALLVLAGCSAATQTVEVRITPELYQLGEVRSAMATPVVDEVVRIDPRRVVLLLCRNTPPAKIIQFEKELRARHEAHLQGMQSEEDCPA